jgi:hypothetical protein
MKQTLPVRLELLEPRIAAGELDALAAELEVGAETGVHLLDVERLGDEVDAAGREGLQAIQPIVEGADENHRRSAQALVPDDETTELVSVHFRHADVEEDDIRRIAAGGGEGKPSPRHGADPVAADGEQAGQQIEVGRGIVDDENGGARIGRQGVEILPEWA